MFCSTWRKWRAPLALGLALAGGADAAQAQFYFRPFAYAYRYELPPEEDEAPRFASRRAVARILAREGYRLVGPLGQRGEQVVATGLSQRDGEMRFFIDPYEGEIIHAIRLAPPPGAERPSREDRGFVPQLGGSHPVVKEIGQDRAPPREARKPDGSRIPAPVQAAKPAVAPKPADNKKAPETARAIEPPAATPGKPAEPAAGGGSAAPAESKAEAAKEKASAPVAAAVKTSPASAPRTTAARSTAASSYRAIVPPKATEGVTVVTPATQSTATAHSPAGPKTPQNVALPRTQ